MAYVICSNVESEDIINLGGHNDPASFLNNFRSPLILQPNTEVAVESVKIDRSDQWDIKDSDKFFLYWGPTQLLGATVSGDVSKNGVRIDIRRGSYNLQGMAKELTRAINNAPIGPSIRGAVEVIIKVDANDKFRGFSFKFTPRIKPADRSREVLAPKSNNYSTIGWDNDPANASKGGEWDSGTATLKCLTNGYNDEIAGDSTAVPPIPSNFFINNKKFLWKMRSVCSYRFDDYPLSNAGGRCVFSCSATNQLDTPFQVGLVRPTNPYVRNGYADEVGFGDETGHTQRSTTFMDFYAVWNSEITDGAVPPVKVGALRLYHWVYGQANGQWTQKEIKYYSTPGQTDYTTVIDKAKIIANEITEIIFELKGNELLVKVKDNLGGTNDETNLIDSTSFSALKYANYPPLGNAKEDLFPAIALTKENQEVILKEWEAHKLDNWKFPSATNYGLQTGTANQLYFPNGKAQLIAGSDWYSNAVLSQNATNELRYNLLRPNLLWKPSGAEVFKYKNLVGGVIDYEPVLICGQESRDTSLSDYDQVLYVIPLPGNEANMSRNLGFGKWNIIDYISFKGSTDTDNLKTLNSIEVAQYTVHSAFVRINDLPIESFNGATSSRSNILYHIPRFSNTGKQFGELFFPVPEKTYIKLNNTDKIMLNQLKIDIVGRNERIVNDLTGASIICLHFRESK